MTNSFSSFGRGDCLSPTNLALLGQPLDFIHEDHLREREMCARLDALAMTDQPDIEEAGCVMAFLAEELPLHLQDEEEDLFPLLRRRCIPEDQIDRAISRLVSDHGHAGDDTPSVISVLQAIHQGGLPPDDRGRRVLTEYASHARRHLILENAIILPFARLRLTAQDLRTLCLRMMKRRGLDRLLELENAQ